MTSGFSQKKIYSEKSLGDRLRALRKRKHLSLEQAEEETKVRRKFLEGLESGNYSSLPADVYAMGFLAKYADFLGGPKEELLETYRQERGSFSLNRVFSPITRSVTRQKRFVLTPKIMTIALIGIIFVGMIGYIAYSIKNFTSPPNLEISTPSTESVLHQDNVEIIGKTDEGVTLQINDQTVFIDGQGNFRETVKLQPGMNNIELKATNRIKKETIKTIKILAEY